MPVPVISLAQMRAWEQATWASGQSEEAVMRRAGQAVARLAERMTRPGDLIWVLAGKGHNGDDACYAAEYLSGRPTRILRVTEPESALEKLGLPPSRQPALILDGLFGIGLNRPLAEPWLQLIRRLNEWRRPILSVDVPSGLIAETGEVAGEAVRASATLTLAALKPGLLQPGAWPFVGRLEVAPEIGLLPCPFTSELQWVMAEDFAAFPPSRPQAGHKGTFGHLTIVSGSLGYHGAGVLAARGAQRAQPGLITLLTDPNVYAPVAGQLQSVMVRPWEEGMPLPATTTGLLVGPGLASPQVPEFVRQFTRCSWQQSPLPMVVDASALDWLPAGPCAVDALRVVTPHPGEAARLLESTAAAVQADRPGSVRRLSERFGHAQVVLKGHQTLVGCSRGAVAVNSSGNPHLAQGGSGDLLSGYLGGLLAQPALQADAAHTIRYAVWQHGAAADFLTIRRSPWVVEELAEVLGRTGGAGLLELWE